MHLEEAAQDDPGTWAAATDVETQEFLTPGCDVSWTWLLWVIWSIKLQRSISLSPSLPLLLCLSGKKKIKFKKKIQIFIDFNIEDKKAEFCK